MSTCYYLSWFNDLLPEKLARCLHEDIQDRKSLVMISGEPSVSTDEPTRIDDVTECAWLKQAGLIFDEYHFIDCRMPKEEARRFVRDASVVFLCGGDPVSQNEFLTDYELSDVIKSSGAVIMGASAGSLNMAAKWSSSIENGREVAAGTVYEGLGFHHFAYESHAKRDYASFVQGYLFPLSEEIEVYAAEQESAIRVKDGKIDVIGPTYLISRAKIQKLIETL
ncbi:Type 1 glutamine amidotransferase-like domain-containing protein [Saccharibacillus alkalitolerans]|uniref:Type 1 glutamine amidotransferase-like domain-containing protein n=1 Tax=Saccharibacillus alkalitolerans TaxID=2705290 RepID=A0ABX0F421_9BACL|nr:Type 1 glutamine amidotransferase-like domain-containing protein [Saccharibacillus alkalitolerans]NGZ75728.1 type 1 glutamine amidotransferase-like domain-containing protein [Saccharibacillus alkalitolerans]